MSRALGGEVAVVREELDVLLAELDRRGHELLDVRLQVRRHAVGTALALLALTGAAAGAVWLSTWRHRRQRSPSARAERLREALARMTEHPDRVAAAPTMAGRILTAAASAAVASLVRRGLEQGVPRLLARRRDGGSAPEPGGREQDREAA
jgi:hypothetical protein